MYDRTCLRVGTLWYRHKSGRGQPHSKTLARIRGRNYIRKVLECGCPLPL
jgi:hypothetical protein